MRILLTISEQCSKYHFIKNGRDPKQDKVEIYFNEIEVGEDIRGKLISLPHHLGRHSGYQEISFVYYIPIYTENIDLKIEEFIGLYELAVKELENEKKEVEKKEENLKLYSLQNGSELLKERILNKFDWVNLAMTEYANGICGNISAEIDEDVSLVDRSIFTDDNNEPDCYELGVYKKIKEYGLTPRLVKYTEHDYNEDGDCTVSIEYSVALFEIDCLGVGSRLAKVVLYSNPEYH